MKDQIKRIDYVNQVKALDFEIVELESFFKTRSKKLLESNYRVNFWNILYITEGQGQHFIDFTGYHYESNNILITGKNQIQRFIINENVKGYIIHINEPFFYHAKGMNNEVFLEFLDKLYGAPLLKIDTNIKTMNRSILELIFKEYQVPHHPVQMDVIASLFQAFILCLSEALPNDNNILFSKDYEHYRSFRNLVDQHYQDYKRVEDYAEMMYVTTKTVNQVTRNVVGLSAKQVIINRVILEIKRLLSQGSLMNYEIAEAVGFSEAANMTKFFKKYTGMSPKDFKEITQENRFE